jgi:hypothetical protein
MMKKLALLLMSLLASSALAGTPSPTSHARVGEPAEIQFSLGSTKLPVTANQSIDEVAGWAKANPQGTIVLDSHASGQPGPATTLALHRARTVGDELVKLGVDPAHIVVETHVKQLDTHPSLKISTTRLSPDAVIVARGADVVLSGREVFGRHSIVARR